MIVKATFKFKDGFESVIYYPQRPRGMTRTINGVMTRPHSVRFMTEYYSLPSNSAQKKLIEQWKQHCKHALPLSYDTTQPMNIEQIWQAIKVLYPKATHIKKSPTDVVYANISVRGPDNRELDILRTPHPITETDTYPPQKNWGPANLNDIYGRPKARFFDTKEQLINQDTIYEGRLIGIMISDQHEIHWLDNENDAWAYCQIEV